MQSAFEFQGKTDESLILNCAGIVLQPQLEPKEPTISG